MPIIQWTASRLRAHILCVVPGPPSRALASERAAPAAPALPRLPMSERFAPAEEFAQKARARALPVSVAAPADPLIARGGGRGNANPPVLRLRFADAAWRGRVACYYSSERLDGAWSADGRELTARAPVALEQGRHRYNCTSRD